MNWWEPFTLCQLHGYPEYTHPIKRYSMILTALAINLAWTGLIFGVIGFAIGTGLRLAL